MFKQEVYEDSKCASIAVEKVNESKTSELPNVIKEDTRTSGPAQD